MRLSALVPVTKENKGCVRRNKYAKKVLHLEGLGFYFNQARLTSSGALIRSASRM
jgi:hypothetical protein